jgi:hypothetical protein
MRRALLLALVLIGGCGVHRAVTKPQEVRMQKFKVIRRVLVVDETTVSARSRDDALFVLKHRPTWTEVDRNVLELEVREAE